MVDEQGALPATVKNSFKMGRPPFVNPGLLNPEVSPGYCISLDVLSVNFALGPWPPLHLNMLAKAPGDPRRRTATSVQGLVRRSPGLTGPGHERKAPQHRSCIHFAASARAPQALPLSQRYGKQGHNSTAPPLLTT